MTISPEQLQESVRERLAVDIEASRIDRGELSIEIEAGALMRVGRRLRDDPALRFAQLTDLCGVDYAAYGQADWKTERASNTGFSRGVSRAGLTAPAGERRFAVVYQLLSLELNARLRVKVYAPGEPPTVPSVLDIWPAANWFEREAFDLFGILFEGHPDLRRILTDYGFIGHPFRKDFPLEGHVEVRYDPEQKRVVYQPVSIENRVLVPRVIREDHRYLVDAKAEESGRA